MTSMPWGLSRRVRRAQQQGRLIESKVDAEVTKWGISKARFDYATSRAEQAAVSALRKHENVMKAAARARSPRRS